MRGKQASRTFAETARHVRPLVAQIRGARVPLDLFAHIAKIFAHIDAQTYVAATDAYILAAIGNAAWPIGVRRARADGTRAAGQPRPRRRRSALLRAWHGCAPGSAPLSGCLPCRLPSLPPCPLLPKV